MFIFNAKESTLAFKLDNGDLMKVMPGEASKQFVPSLFQLQAILAMGDPSEVAIILSSSYEMDLLRQLNGAVAYIKSSIQVAREELMEGKVIEEPEVNVNIEAEKLKATLADKDKEVNVLQDRVKELETELANSPANELTEKLKLSNEELTRTKSEVSELQSKLSNVESELINKEKELASSKTELDNVSRQLADANQKISDSVASSSSEIEILNQKLKQAEDRIVEFENAPKAEGVNKDEFDAKVAELDAARKEIEQLQKDAVTIVDKYNQARTTLTSVMDKFGITYNGTEFVKAEQ